MDFNTFLNNSVEVTDSVICGKIMLQTKDWEISFVCDFCHKNFVTLPDLLRHTLSQHVEDVPPEKLQELCGVEIINQIDLENEDCNEIVEETFDDEQLKEHEFIDKIEIIRDVEDDIEDELKSEIDHEEYYEEDLNSSSTIQIEEPVQETKKKAPDVEFEFLNVKKKNKVSEEDPPLRIPKRLRERSPKLKCNVCAQKFLYRKDFVAHRKSHPAKPFICKQCGASFAEKGNMKEHCFRHLGYKPFICDTCQKAFTTAAELKAHIRSHTGERPYKCLECGKGFTSASHLGIHRRTHSDERPHLCSNCGRTFQTSSKLKNHMLMHSSHRPHICQKCNAGFKDRSGLRQHMQIHSDVKKHNCKFCDKSFAQHAGLYSHIKTVHNKEK